LLAGETAENLFTRKPSGETEANAILDERRKFKAYISGLSQQGLASTTPLPYRRVLNQKESATIRALVKQRWGATAGSYWYPLSSRTSNDIEAFDAEAFHEVLAPSIMRETLKARGIARIWNLTEYGPEYEYDLEWLSAFYNGDEQFFVSKSMDWIVYASHENSITIGGFMLDEVKQYWKDWEQHLWNKDTLFSAPVPGPCA
jgi:hypothetical protein